MRRGHEADATSLPSSVSQVVSNALLSIQPEWTNLRGHDCTEKCRTHHHEIARLVAESPSRTAHDVPSSSKIAHFGGSQQVESTGSIPFVALSAASANKLTFGDNNTIVASLGHHALSRISTARIGSFQGPSGSSPEASPFSVLRKKLSQKTLKSSTKHGV